MSTSDILLQDLRYATRVVSRNPGFTAVTVFALALGIGVNVAVFTAYKAMVLRPLDARAAGELVNIAVIRDAGGSDFNFSYPDYTAYRDSMRSFRGVIAFRNDRMRLSDAGAVVSQRSSDADSALGRLGLLPSGASNLEFATVFGVSQNYLEVIGVQPVRGREFSSMRSSELAGLPPALISENYWQRRFGGDPGILGRTVRLNGVAVTIIGITPHDFVGTSIAVPDLWIPLSLESLFHADGHWLADRENLCCRIVARLASGASISGANAEMNVVADRLRALHDPHSDAAKPAKVIVWPGSPFPLPISLYPGLGLTILLIMAAAAMVLLVACANVASLQLARARSRQAELDIRSSLGATRLRIVRLLLTENAMMSLMAGGVALLVTWGLLRVAAKMAADVIPAELGTLIFDVNPDLGVFAYVFGLSILAGVLFGIAPALESSRSALASAVRGATRPVRSRRLQNLLLTAQVALCVVLMIAGSSLVRSARRTLKSETGYETRHVLDINLQFPDGPAYLPERRLAIVRAIRTQLSVLPGVVAISSGKAPDEAPFRTAAAPSDEHGDTGQAQSLLAYNYVEANYLETLGIPLLSGRSFSPHSGEVEHALILSESAAQQLFPERNPIGRSVHLGLTDERRHNRSELFAGGRAYEVIGVARDTRGVDFDGRDARKVYLPLTDDRLASRPILIRTRGEPAQINSALDRIVAAIDPDVAVTSSTLDEILRQTGPFIVSSLAAAVASSIGLLGLVLACMGIGGTVSYIVASRTREVGIRVAIGAQKHDIVGLILRESAAPVIAGLAAGAMMSVGMSYALRGVLYSVRTADLQSVLGVSGLFLAIALAAAYRPTRRALRIDPTVALRYE